MWWRSPPSSRPSPPPLLLRLPSYKQGKLASCEWETRCFPACPVAKGCLDTEIGQQSRKCRRNLQYHVDPKPQICVFASQWHSGHQVATLYHTPVNTHCRSNRAALRLYTITRCHAVYFWSQCPRRQRQTEKQNVLIKDAISCLDHTASVVDSSWNVMAHGDAREEKWRRNWRMEWVASTLHATTELGVSSITTADAHTSAASSRLNWRSRRYKRTRPFRRKTKYGFCACAITFQLASRWIEYSYGTLVERYWKVTTPPVLREKPAPVSLCLAQITPITLIFSGYWGLFSGVKRSGKIDNWLLYNAKFKNRWI